MRAAYQEIELYDPQRQPCAVDLSDNTNLFGIAPTVARVLAMAEPHKIARYPAVFAKALKHALAERHDVSPENIATGCGSDDVIDSAMRAFCDAGAAVVYPWPTFGVVSTFARMNAARPLAISMGADFIPDAEQLRRANGCVTYVCAPNNPTGTAVPMAVIEELATSLPGVLLLDEAYADFADQDCSRIAAGSQRMISLRTFSKAFGLAGLRIGYAIGPAELIHEIEKSRGPYKVSALAEAAALAALEDAGWVNDVVLQTRCNRTRLENELRRIGLRFWPSATNFVLMQTPAGQDAQSCAAGLRERGVSVRPFAALPHAGECIRVTIGPWSMMERFLEALA